MDGGDDDQRDERTTSPKNVCWLYYLSVVFFGCYLFGLPHAGYGRGIMTENGGGDNGTNIAEESTLAILPVCCFGFLLNLFVVSHMLAMADGQRRGGWW